MYIIYVKIKKYVAEEISKLEELIAEIERKEVVAYCPGESEQRALTAQEKYEEITHIRRLIEAWRQAPHILKDFCEGREPASPIIPCHFGPCPKCEAAEPGLEYVAPLPADVRNPIHTHTIDPTVMALHKMDRRFGDAKHLIVTCKRCGYVWKGAVEKQTEGRVANKQDTER